MTLAQLVSFVCDKSGLIEPEDRVACKSFLSKRYELIFNQYLWKDSLVAVDVTVDPDDADNAEGIVLLPEVINRVVAVRTTQQSVRVAGLEDFYRVDCDQFVLTGQPYKFAILSPVWFVWRGLVGLKITSAAGDDNTIIKITWRDTNGRRYVQLITLNSGDPPLLEDAPLTNTVEVTGNAEYNGTYTWDGTQFSASGGKYIAYDAGSGQWQLRQPDEFSYSTTGSIAGGTWVNEGGGLPIPTFSAGVTTKIEIESVFKPATTGNVVFAPQLVGEDDGDTLLLTDTRSPAYQRLRLFSIPTVETTLSVLGKKIFTPLDFDQEEPEIRNLDNCLIAFAMADMLTRARQYGKAQTQLAEGTALLQELAKLETMQAANNSRFVPDGGYGDVFFGPSSQGGFLDY